MFAGVTPFNFPAMIPLWFLPHAVATGNTFVLKPSEQDPLIVKRIVELVETGFPDGVVNVVQGGSDMLKGILVHEGIAGVSSVDNTPVTRHIYETGAAHGKRVQAQGGVKNHIIVTESADPGRREGGRVRVCLRRRAVSREGCCRRRGGRLQHVHKPMEREMRAMTVGSGLDDGVDVGPPISAEHLETVRG